MNRGRWVAMGVLTLVAGCVSSSTPDDLELELPGGDVPAVGADTSQAEVADPQDVWVGADPSGGDGVDTSNPIAPDGDLGGEGQDVADGEGSSLDAVSADDDGAPTTGDAAPADAASPDGVDAASSEAIDAVDTSGVDGSDPSDVDVTPEVLGPEDDAAVGDASDDPGGGVGDSDGGPPGPDASADVDGGPDDAALGCDASCQQAGLSCDGDDLVTCALGPGGCLTATTASCDDGLGCTANTCSDGACVTTPVGTCGWPAEPIAAATNLTAIEGPPTDNDFYDDLSGAVWDPMAETLWLCRNAGPSKIWAVVDDGAGGMEVAYKDGNRGEWSGFGDAEGLTLADYTEPETLYVMAEGVERIREYDMSTYGVATLHNEWDIQDITPTGGGLGSEGLTFVPDAFLAAQGFVDSSGAPYLSTLGMGGLMFVGHQNGGHLYVFDLDRAAGAHVFIGQYETAATETAGLEFDRSTGLLFIWHGAGFNSLEVAHLGSDPADPNHRLNTLLIYDGPGSIPSVNDNYEGIAVTSNAACSAGSRSLFLTSDDAGASSLFRFDQFPCQ